MRAAHDASALERILRCVPRNPHGISDYDAMQLVAEVKRLREEVTLIDASRDNLVTMTQRALRGTIARAEAAEKRAVNLAEMLLQCARRLEDSAAIIEDECGPDPAEVRNEKRFVAAARRLAKGE